MASSSRVPAEPLLVVLGTTGTGKSELAVELATRFKGEVINTDAMQLYNGLPIITNKITTAEQRGIPHHLLGHIPLEQAPWDVDDFKREASRVIREIRGRGNLPILVGGTHYYLEPLLFKDVILDDVQIDPERTFEILEESTETMLEELRRVDPVMAEKWHPNDRRKIQRSLEIFLHTGRPASEFYAEQRGRKAAAARELEESEPWEKLLFWVYSDRDVLRKRLDKRVDKMLDAGLLDEVRELYEVKRSSAAEGRITDMTKGIWQSIGYKQFEPYLAAADDDRDPSDLEKLKSKALEDMQVATRRYANYQTKWIRLKQMPLIKEQGTAAVNSLYLLDSTDVSQFGAHVVDPAAALASQFLQGDPRPPPTEVSALARDVLTRAAEPPAKEVACKRTCEVCRTVAVTEKGWQMHVSGASHRRAVKRRTKLALVPVERPVDGERDSESGKSERESLDGVASMFT